jgi:shikimate kinase/3-dehydroquinate synthase
VGKGTSGSIVLTGFSYTGKTRVGREVAERLGWRFIDTDEEIVRLAGKPIAEIFAQEDEDRFRELERQVLEGLGWGGVVVSTGGGAIMDAGNRRLMMDCAAVVCLDAKPATIYRRLLKDAEDSPDEEVRPLLSGPEPLKRIEWLKTVRQPFYALSDWTVDVDNLTVEEAAEEVIRGWKYAARGRAAVPDLPTARESDAPYCQEKGAACEVSTAGGSYPVFVGWGCLDQLGMRMRNAGLSGRAFVISDDRVLPLHGDRVARVLGEAGFAPQSRAVPEGEGSKSLEMAGRLYDWLVEKRCERGDTVVALGGGVAGDLAGFVSATFLRGLPLVQVPTSLMAMVDSSIGGKVAINHPEGKNLVGAFYQPRLVLTDVGLLSTLPRRELVSGWAEVVKHAMIRDSHLLRLLEEHVKELLGLGREPLSDVVARSAAIKASVVSEDEREQGLRTILNYGHTIAHGLEAATGYERLLHGEAVSIGMAGAAMISRRLGLLSADVAERQVRLLDLFGLPVVASSDLRIEDILRAMALDKKTRGERIRWVLLEDVARPVIRDDVPRELAEQVIRDLLQR